MPREEDPKEPSGGPPSRRQLLLAGGVVSGLAAAATSVPLISTFVAPVLSSAGDESWIPVGPGDAFGPDRKEHTYSFVRKEGFHESLQVRRVVVSRNGDEFDVLSPKCSHLGCGVVWKADEKKFFCPCHGGEFDSEGNPTVPPPDKPLKRLEARLNASTGQLEVLES